MEKINLKQMREIYTRATKLGLHDKSLGREDNLHVMIFRICKKTSIAELTYAEAQKAIIELRELSEQNAMSEYQIKRAWALYYELKKLSPSSAKDGERMAGIISKACGIKTDSKKLFAYASKSDGQKIIETLKRYISSALRKAGEEFEGRGH